MTVVVVVVVAHPLWAAHAWAEADRPADRLARPGVVATVGDDGIAAAVEDEDGLVCVGARAEVVRAARVRRDRADVAHHAAGVVREVAAHREARHEDVGLVEALVLRHVGLHGLDEREVVTRGADLLHAARRRAHVGADVPGSVNRVGPRLTVGNATPMPCVSASAVYCVITSIAWPLIVRP